jgi:hypothetical protein
MAYIGALIILLLLSFGPFSQQSVSIELQDVADNTSFASIPHAVYHRSFTDGGFDPYDTGGISVFQCKHVPHQ